MLLSSQSFSGFLQELSTSGPAEVTQKHNAQQQQNSQQAQPQQQHQPQPTRKDLSSHDAARQMQMQNHSDHHMQVGMTLIPDTPIDMSAFDGHSSWNNTLPSNDFQVFAVTELPEPPKLDMSAMTEKSCEVKPMRSSKKDLPVIPYLPTSQSSKKESSAVERSDDLYADDSCTSTVSITLPTSLYTTLSKAAVSSAILSSRTASSGTSSDLQQLCDELDETCDAISRYLA